MKFRRFSLRWAALCSGLAPASAEPAPKIWFQLVAKPCDDAMEAPQQADLASERIMDAHKGKTDWDQPIVRDQDYAADYISMAAGAKTKPQFWADDPHFAYVASGQIRFHIEARNLYRQQGFLCRCPICNTLLDGDGGQRTPACALKWCTQTAPRFYPAAQGNTGRRRPQKARPTSWQATRLRPILIPTRTCPIGISG